MIAEPLVYAEAPCTAVRGTTEKVVSLTFTAMEEWLVLVSQAGLTTMHYTRDYDTALRIYEAV